MARTRCDIATPGGGFELHWWLAITAPMLDASGKVNAIIHQVTRVTELHLAEEAAQTRRLHQAFLLKLSDTLRTEVEYRMSDKTARASTDISDFRDRFRNWIDALSRIRGLLSRLRSATG